MNGYQLTIIIGTAGADAEVKNLEGGSTVATMVCINTEETIPNKMPINENFSLSIIIDNSPKNN